MSIFTTLKARRPRLARITNYHLVDKIGIPIERQAKSFIVNTPRKGAFKKVFASGRLSRRL